MSINNITFNVTDGAFSIILSRMQIGGLNIIYNLEFI